MKIIDLTEYAYITFVKKSASEAVNSADNGVVLILNDKEFEILDNALKMKDAETARHFIAKDK